VGMVLNSESAGRWWGYRILGDYWWSCSTLGGELGFWGAWCGVQIFKAGWLMVVGWERWVRWVGWVGMGWWWMGGGVGRVHGRGGLWGQGW